MQNNDVERHGCFKGPFTWRYQEDPRRLNNFTLGFKQRTFCPCGTKIDKVREGNKALKIAGDKSKSALVPSAFSSGVNIYLLAELSQ